MNYTKVKAIKYANAGFDPKGAQRWRVFYPPPNNAPNEVTDPLCMSHLQITWV